MKQAQETKSTHTQGEWESAQILGATDIVSGSIRIALINHNSTPTLEEAKSNAKLIAAAPDLLQALITIVQGCNDDNGFSSLAAIESIAQQAINKATL